MIRNATKNWKKFLGVDDEAMLNDIIANTAKHRGAYKNADDVKIAQLWCSLIEAQKQMNKMDQRLKRIEYILGGLIKRSDDDRERLLKSLRNF